MKKLLVDNWIVSLWIGLVMGISVFSSSCFGSLSVCFTFDEESYLTGDTIVCDASCSVDAEEFQWIAGEGLQMLGTGNGLTEQFLITPLSGTVGREVILEVSAGRSTRRRSKAALVL